MKTKTAVKEKEGYRLIVMYRKHVNNHHGDLFCSFDWCLRYECPCRILFQVSKISLVDLAGSERADSTGAKGTRLKVHTHFSVQYMWTQNFTRTDAALKRDTEITLTHLL